MTRSEPGATPGGAGGAGWKHVGGAGGASVEHVGDHELDRERHADRGMLLAWWAKHQPDAVAVDAPSGVRTFRELNQRANQLARALRRRGVRAGAGVALLCGNRVEVAEVVAASQRAGWRLTPINTHLTVDEAAYILDDCGAVALVADTAWAGVAAEALGRARDCTVGLAVGGAIDGFRSYDDELVTEDDGDIDDPTLGISMLYTSGTTGRPKGVYRRQPPPSVLTRTNLFGYREGDRHLCTGPLYHAAPLAFSLSIPLTHGAGVVVMERWDAEEALRLVQQHRITHTHMVATMFHRLLSLPAPIRERFDVSSLRHVLHGAAPCPVEIKRRLIGWLGPVVWEYYAATEGTACFVDSETWLARPGTVGRPPAGQVIVGDEDGVALPTGATGLVYLRAPEVGRFEYYKDPDKTASTYRGEYFTLGDVGHVDDDGYLFLTDRSSNLIISGGVNIYPAEVDAVLIEHPAVGDVATIGVPDAEWGERVVAVVELQPGVEESADLAAAMVAHCRARLARYKCPQAVEFTDQLPRQENGKIYKRILRDRYRAGAESQPILGG